jgi:hypothetical protein
MSCCFSVSFPSCCCLKSRSPKDNTVCAIFSTAMAISTGSPGECGCFEPRSYYTLFSPLWLSPWLGLLPV